MHDCKTLFVRVVPCDPHFRILTECRDGKNGAANPCGFLSLGRSHHLNMHFAWREGSEFFDQTLAEAWEHGISARKADIAEEVLVDACVGLHDCLKRNSVQTPRFLSEQAGSENHLWTAEAFAADCDDLAVWQLVVPLTMRALFLWLHSSSLPARNTHEATLLPKLEPLTCLPSVDDLLVSAPLLQNQRLALDAHRSPHAKSSP